MTLMILAGVWALAFGYITIDNKVNMKGNKARIFGLLLIAVAAYVLPHINHAVADYVPKFIGKNDTFKSAFDLLIGAGTIYATGLMANQVLPRLKLPSVKLSVKRGRA